VYRIEYVSYRQGPYRIRIVSAAYRIVPTLKDIHVYDLLYFRCDTTVDLIIIIIWFTPDLDEDLAVVIWLAIDTVLTVVILALFLEEVRFVLEHYRDHGNIGTKIIVILGVFPVTDHTLSQ